MADLLVLNAGSSSVKFARFGARPQAGSVTEIGGVAKLDGVPVAAPDHKAALQVIFDALGGVQGIAAVGHRVVHGGAVFSDACLIDAAAEAQIEALSSLAPLHNPVALSAIRAVRDLAPDLPQVAVFDTAFHQTIPDVAQRYAIPEAWAAKGVRRYGFHGTSYASLVARLPRVMGADLPKRVLACHMGNGASMCAILDGRSVATSMGFSPVSGLTMGTRAGEIDANAVLFLAEELGIEGAGALLNKGSGLLGLGGHSDMRRLAAEGSLEAALAMDHFAHRAVMEAGGLIAAMGGVDAIVFTGGIGENDVAMRARICGGLSWVGLELVKAANVRSDTCIAKPDAAVSAWIVAAEEEAEIARQMRAILDG